MMNCYYCKEVLTTENESVEHIIPNAIGGRLKSKELLCKKCNSLLGEQVDSKFCNSLSPLSGFLDIQRERGTNPDIKNIKSNDGKLYNLVNGRYPVPVSPEINFDESKNRFHISARNEKEMRHIIKKLKKKYPNLDDNELESKMIRGKYYMNEALNMQLQLGNNEFMKALLKIAINFYLHRCSRVIDLHERIEELRNTNDIPVSIIRHYYTKDSIKYEDTNEVSHTIYIKGDSSTKLLYAFIEIFSSAAFIINLNTEYNGPEASYSYTYDVLLNKEISKKITFNYDGELKGDEVELNKEFISRLQKKLSRVLVIADKRQVDAIISNITKEVMADILSKYPDGTLINEEMFNEFAKAISEEVAPFIAHLHNRQNR